MVKSDQTSPDSLFEKFKIERLIFHFISRDQDTEKASVKFFPQIIDLGPEGTKELRTRITNAVSQTSQALEMSFKSENEVSFKEIIKSFSSDLNDEGFIQISHNLTNHLFNILKDNKTIPLGAVLVIQGIVGEPNHQCLVVIKAETHSGFTADFESTDSRVEFIKNLFLTPQQKLYKVAFVINTSDATNEDTLANYTDSDVRVFIFDSNAAASKLRPAAQYFYDRFMGCNHSKNSAFQTQQFYTETKNHIEVYYTDIERRLDYVNQLKLYLKMGTSNMISMRDFADHYISDPEEQQAYYSHMQDKGAPTESVYKDLKRINSHLKTRRVKFSSGITVSGSVQDFKDNVNVINNPLEKLFDALPEEIVGNLTLNPDIIEKIEDIRSHINQSNILQINGSSSQEM
jgi:hypothetical protein